MWELWVLSGISSTRYFYGPLKSTGKSDMRNAQFISSCLWIKTKVSKKDYRTEKTNKTSGTKSYHTSMTCPVVVFLTIVVSPRLPLRCFANKGCEERGLTKPKHTPERTPDFGVWGEVLDYCQRARQVCCPKAKPNVRWLFPCPVETTATALSQNRQRRKQCRTTSKQSYRCDGLGPRLLVHRRQGRQEGTQCCSIRHSFFYRKHLIIPTSQNVTLLFSYD